MTAQYQVFISYQRSDTDVARLVREHLVASGVRTWMDAFDVPVGAYWPDEIDKGLAASETVVGILSPDAVASRNVKNEWDWAIQNGKRLLLLQVQPCIIPHRYVSINFIDASVGLDAAFAQLVDAIAPPAVSPSISCDGAPARPFQRGHSVAPEAPEPFVGRERELLEARAALDAAFRGRRQLLLLAGEPGIGKTRLAEVVAGEATERGALAYWGRCFEWEGAPPYWPWIEILRTHAEALEPAALRQVLGPGAPFLGQIIPELALLLGDTLALPAMDPDQARFRLFDAVARFLRQAASERPFVAVLDDLHWADEPSLQLLEFVTRELQQTPLLLIGTFRDTEIRREHPLGRSLAALTRAAEPRRITLRGLPAEDVDAYVREIAGHAVDPAMVQAVSDGTDGNPFYLGEVVRLLRAEGRLERDLVSPAGTALVLPESVRDVVGRRLDGLSADCNAVLGVGAVIGREFTITVLERATGRSAPELLDLLDEAGAARVVEQGSTFGHYRFSHAFIQQTLYDELSTGARLQLHDRVGQALETANAASRAAHASELAHHFASAPIGANILKAIDYTLQAGASATSQVAWETAIIHYRQALQLIGLLEAPDQALKCDVLLALGEALFQLRADSPPAIEALLQAAAIARELGSAERLARAAISVHGLNIFESYAIVDEGELLQEALAKLEPGDSVLRVRLLAQLAVVRWRDLPTPELPRALCEEAITMARRLNDPAALAFAIAVRHATVAGPDNLGERLADAAEVSHLAGTVGDSRLGVWGQFWQSSDLLEHGDVAGAVDAMDHVIAGAVRLRAQVFDCVSIEAQILRSFVTGALDDAELFIERLKVLMLSVDGSGAFWRFRRHQQFPYQFMLYREQERLAEIEPETRVYRSNDCTPIYRILRMLLDWELGNEAAAVAEWESVAAAGFCDIPRDAVWLSKIVLLADFASMVQDDRRAYLLLQCLTPYAGRIVVDGPNSLCYGAATHYIGLLATTLTDWELAAGAFEIAIAEQQRIGLLPYAARSRHALAEMLARRAAPGDRYRALELLDESLAVARERGMPKLIRQASELRERLLAPQR